jgi:AraC family transcriptional regulator
VQTSNTEGCDKTGSVDRAVWSADGLHTEHSRSWGLISAGIVKRDAGEVTWRSNHHRVTVSLAVVQGTARIDDGPAQSFRFAPGDFSFTPAGVSTTAMQPAGRLLQTVQSLATYDDMISEIVRGSNIQLEQRHPVNDPLVSQIVSTLVREAESDFLDHILVDALNTALAVRMVRHFVDPSKFVPTPSNGLSCERLQRVRDYIEAHIDDRLTLADIAGVACLSPCHFSRSFKQAVCVGPQRYVMERRIERAKTLMRRTRQPLALIALEVGFTDQSHLSSVFRRATGMTPGRFRAALA